MMDGRNVDCSTSHEWCSIITITQPEKFNAIIFFFFSSFAQNVISESVKWNKLQRKSVKWNRSNLEWRSQNMQQSETKLKRASLQNCTNTFIRNFHNTEFCLRVHSTANRIDLYIKYIYGTYIQRTSRQQRLCLLVIYCQVNISSTFRQD